MSDYANEFDKKIRKKKKQAMKYFKDNFSNKEKRAKREICREILNQIQICEELLRPVGETQIKDWFECVSVEQLLRKARTHKFEYQRAKRNAS